jgi:hypothetical protein
MNKSLTVTGDLTSTGQITGGALNIATSAGDILFGTDAGGSLAIGLKNNTSSSPYFDFNSGSTTVDYDVRMQVTGGNGTAGNGDLDIKAGTVRHNGVGLATTFSTNVVTTSSTASANNHYYLNAATVTLTLPASPSVGDEVRISEVAGNTDCVIGRNGSNIMGDASDLTIDTAYLVLSLRYVDATIGWAFS